VCSSDLTFDINPACALEVGWHLFGEDYMRGQFLVRMREELSKYEIAGELGISITGTFYNWQEKYPEFLEAVKESEHQAMIWWERRGREKTFESAGFNSTAYIFQMKNRFHKQYKDRIAHEGADGGPITVKIISYGTNDLDTEGGA